MPTALPPLNALKAFEAAARCNGFVVAAKELGVSPSAVSQLVRKLELHLGKTLFQRANNRIQLTDAGKALFAGVTPPLTEIAETVARARKSMSRRKIVVSAISSVGECWLAPALPRFLAAYPRIRIDLRIDDESSNFPSDADLRIHYGRLPSSEAIQTELMRDAVVPMCAPQFLQQRNDKLSFTSVLSKDLIHTSWGPTFGTNPTWQDWFGAFAQGQRVDMNAGHQVNASRLALQLAKSGAGVILGQRWLGQADLQNHALIELSPNALPMGQSYYMSWLPASVRQTEVMTLKDWLMTDVNPVE